MANGLFPKPVNDPSARKCKPSFATIPDEPLLTGDRLWHLWLNDAWLHALGRRRDGRFAASEHLSNFFHSRHSLTGRKLLCNCNDLTNLLSDGYPSALARFGL
jgi:hypothetical protein